MIAIRLGLYLSLMLLVGFAAFPLYALRKGERCDGAILATRRVLIFWAVAAILLSLLGFLALVAAMMGSSIAEVDWQTSRSIIVETPIGAAWVVRVVALIACLFAAILIKRSDEARLVAILGTSTAALATLVWTGHAGATEGMVGGIHKVSDMLHMIAAAIWLGGIAAFLKMLRAPDDGLWGDRPNVAHRALDSFARIGTISVAVIVVTGLINGQILVGISNITALFDSTYGWLLIVKLLLVGMMMLLAAQNRWRLTPGLAIALSDGDIAKAVAALRASLLLEAAAGILVLGAVAWLGTLEPTASAAMS
ncbi:copper homeostasis membrane protein CopD [Sphingobium fluviale]|uniref:Copper resistance D family protein n=1 Tax=Sphingobium fluviale TaxID=2506423 RepID=A0A4Q1KDS4_9SPHN|nr:copper homeostasis membrane protein CopD [Sphingobium fluviale]RXR25553.1 copper resistance D family protein [Sphingobium fluviale]